EYHRFARTEVTVWCGQAWASLLAQGNVPTVPTVLYILARHGYDPEEAIIRAQSFRLRRCLMPASSFYELHRMPSGRKAPYWIGMKNKAPFARSSLPLPGPLTRGPGRSPP